MSIDEVAALEALLARLRAVNDEMKVQHVGVAVLHTDAAIASLESHLRKRRGNLTNLGDAVSR